jgi:hypothetical protein
MSVGIGEAFFSTRTVTTAGATALTTPAYDVAGAVAARAVVTRGLTAAEAVA